ncbi:MAG: putative protease [Mariniblastus sp.]|jgi:putative protease
MSLRRVKPELMSPAGHWPQLQTAIEAGADAVYFGLNHFSARAKVGFTLDELSEAMQTLHGRGVKGFVTFNTLVFDHEVQQAEQAIMAMAAAGVDAVIVQDVGVAGLIHRIAPGLTIHGSTQMSITSAQGAELAKSLGCSRVVLGRELSLDNMRKIAEATDVELETFVHGALCVSYSGQCFSSEAWGGRSANRGKCAQACRLSYDLLVDGEPRDLGPYRYLLSPGDLCAIEQIPELVEIGIACVKIEGRYKDAEYVGLTTRAYREAIDLAWANLENEIEADERLELEQIYSRGLGPHFISGTNHQTVVEGRAPRHRGVKIGQVTEVARNSVEIKSFHPVKRGDGIVFDAADWRSPDEPEEGGHVYEVRERDDALVELEFGHDSIDFSRIRVGDLVWRTHDAQLIKSLKPLTKTEVPVFTRPISFSVSAKLGSPIEIEARLESGETVVFDGPAPLEPAQKRALDLDILTEKLGRLGGTPFHLDVMELLTEDAVFVPTSQLNQARRLLVDTLFEQCCQTVPIESTATVDSELERIQAKKQAAIPTDAEASTPIELHLLVRTPEQLDAALAAATTLAGNKQGQVGSITLDYLELYGLRPSVEKIRAAGFRPRVASPRILKPSEQNVIRFLRSLECDILVRSGGLLFDLINQTTGPEDASESATNDPSNSSESTSNSRSTLAEDIQLIGDFSLNAANAFSAWTYLDMGLTRITPAYDLNSLQITELVERVPCPAVEVIAYSHLPVFHMEHCVFCRFLSDGTDHTNCGHPCEKHQVSVRDSQGRAHPVMADVGCRNTVFGAEAQTDPTAVANWRSAGIHHFRLEFVHQTPDQVKTIATSFGNFFNSDVSQESLATLQASINEASPQETTQGSLYVASDFKSLVQLE